LIESNQQDQALKNKIMVVKIGKRCQSTQDENRKPLIFSMIIWSFIIPLGPKYFAKFYQLDLVNHLKFHTLQP
jgi:hypothetical protein